MKKTLQIEGMHCVSCELLLEKTLKKISGVVSCHVSQKKGCAEINTSKDIPMRKFQKAVESCGFSISEKLKKEKQTRRKKNSLKDFFTIGGIILVFFLMYLLLKNLHFSFTLPDIRTEGSILIAFTIGFVASISTCLVLVGGIVMGFGSMYGTEEKGPSLLQRIRPHLYFHGGRIIGFFLLGALLGLLGSKIQYSLTFTGYLTILVAIILFYIGLNILNFVPSITEFGFHLPKSLSKKIHNLEENDHHITPIILGVFTFFLPCGFTQSMQLTAVASGNMFSGGMIMGAFAIGTLPVLLGVGFGSSYARNISFPFMKKMVGVLILFFSLYSLNSGLVLAGYSFSIDFWNTSENAVVASKIEESKAEPAIQVVKMDVDWTFSPTKFTVQKDIPVRWEINGINVSGCSNEVVIPKLDIRKKIKTGLNVIEFTPTETGTIPFSCWMGMLNGEFVVVDEIAIDAKYASAESESPKELVDYGEETEEETEPVSPPRASCGSSCTGTCGGTCGNPSCSY